MSDVLRNLCYILISSCGIAICKYLISLVNKKINEIQVNTEIKEYEKLNQYIDSAQEAISSAVLSISQVYVDSLKSSGGFTKEAQEEAKTKAVERAKELITEESKNAIIIIYGNFDTYLDSMIETIVRESKIEINVAKEN